MNEVKRLQHQFYVNCNNFISGKGGELVDRGDNTYGGKWVVNPSGGLISKGHPLGATGNPRPFENVPQSLAPAEIYLVHKAILLL